VPAYASLLLIPMGKFSISSLSREQIDRVKPVLEKTRNKPFRFLLNDLQGDLDFFWLKEIADMFQSRQVEIFFAGEEENMLGLVVYTDLP